MKLEAVEASTLRADAWGSVCAEVTAIGFGADEDVDRTTEVDHEVFLDVELDWAVAFLEVALDCMVGVVTCFDVVRVRADDDMRAECDAEILAAAVHTPEEIGAAPAAVLAAAGVAAAEAAAVDLEVEYEAAAAEVEGPARLDSALTALSAVARGDREVVCAAALVAAIEDEATAGVGLWAKEEFVRGVAVGRRTCHVRRDTEAMHNWVPDTEADALAVEEFGFGQCVDIEEFGIKALS